MMTNEEFRNIRHGALGKLRTAQIGFYLGVSSATVRGYLQGRCKIPKDIGKTMAAFEKEVKSGVWG